MADYVSPDARRRIATGLMAAQYAENPPTAPMGYDFDAAPLSPGLMNFAAQRGQPGVIQKTLGLIPGFDQDGKRAAQSWGNALMSTAQFPIDAVAGMGQALTAPARAYRGEFDPTSEEGVGEALNVAGNAMMGGLAAPKPRNVVGSAGGSLVPDAAALDMSQAARMQRARNMGYDTDRTWYRGGKTARDELKAAGSEVQTPAIWFSSSPDRASEFAMMRAKYGNYADLKADYNPSVTPAYTGGNYKTFEGMFQAPNFERMSKQLEQAKADGYDGAIFKRLNDRPGASGPSLFNSSDVLAKFDGSNIRSPNAAFDPAKADSANLLYANGGRPGAATGAALGAIPDTPGIRAYHGSPHDFDKFDLSKIGSGEGAQAYGHGLYFAENEGVAKSYRDGLTQVDGYQGTAADLIRHHSGDRVAALNEAKRGIDKYAATDPPTSREWQKVAGVLSDETYSGPGRMYEVNIKANPDDFLDWDKRLGEQSANVRDKVKSLMLASREIPADPEGAYKQAIERYNAGPKATAVTDDPGVIQAYDAMRLARQGDKAFDRQKIGALLQESGRWSPEDARRTFLDAGIPGVKYLDRGSRTAGDGTSNYVVFDDKLIEILRKYGLLGMAGGAAAAEYGGNSLMPSRPASPQYRPGDA